MFCFVFGISLIFLPLQEDWSHPKGVIELEGCSVEHCLIKKRFCINIIHAE